MATRKNIQSSKASEDLLSFKANRRLSVSITVTVQIVQYEPIKIYAGLSEDIPESADIDVEYERLFDEVSAQVQHYQKTTLGEV